MLTHTPYRLVALLLFMYSNSTYFIYFIPSQLIILLTDRSICIAVFQFTKINEQKLKKCLHHKIMNHQCQIVTENV